MTDLVTFLNARLDDDERIAKAAVGDHYSVSFGHSDWTVVEHVDRWTSARVLADVTAKRQIVAAIGQWQHDDPDDGGFYACPATRTEPLGDLGPESFGEENCTCGVRARRRQIAALLAQPYADHPDFDPAWKP